MYEELNCFEEALKHFGTRVEIICAMELGGRIGDRRCIPDDQRRNERSEEVP